MTPGRLPLVLFCGGGSGGHLTPGLAVAEELRRGDDPPEILFLTGDRPVERRMMAAEPFPYRAFPLGSLRRTFTSWSAARGFAGAFRAAREAANGRPTVVVGTGGYASVPGVLGAKSAGAALLLLEPNDVPGRATRWLAGRADAVLTHERAAFELLRQERLGVPIRSGPAEVAVRPRDLQVLGGSQGAASLDRAVPEALASLGRAANGWRVWHQCGTNPGEVAKAYGDARLSAAGLRAGVGETFPDAPLRLARSAVSITRGGAVTLAEAEAYGAPLIVVPHPRVPDRHQHANAARHVRSVGGTIVEDGPNLVADLAAALREAMAERPPMVRTRTSPEAATAVAERIRGELRRLGG